MMVHIAGVQRALLFSALLLASLPGAVSAAPPEPGYFELSEGPDVAGGLVLSPEGHFEYFLIAGALDEQARGRWVEKGDAVCLYTEPKPVPPAFARGDRVGTDDESATLLVTWPNGRGIAGIDFVIGFAVGDPIEGYTQEDGWTLPADEPRQPQWIEVSEAIYGITAPRFDLRPEDQRRLHLILVPNDLGTVDFDGACLEATPNGIILHRKEGDMRFLRVAAEEE